MRLTIGQGQTEVILLALGRGPGELCSRLIKCHPMNSAQTKDAKGLVSGTLWNLGKCLGQTCRTMKSRPNKLICTPHQIDIDWRGHHNRRRTTPVLRVQDQRGPHVLRVHLRLRYHVHHLVESWSPAAWLTEGRSPASVTVYIYIYTPRGTLCRMAYCTGVA